MKAGKRATILSLSFLLMCVACNSPLGGLFGQNKTSNKPTTKKPRELTVKTYWEKKTYYDGEIIGEHRSSDGTRLEGTYIKQIPRIPGRSVAVTERLEQAASNRFFISVGKLTTTGAFLTEPVHGTVTALVEQTDKQIKIDKGSKDGIQEGYFFTIKHNDTITVDDRILMFGDGERLGNQTMIKALGRVISVGKDTCVAETFGFRDYLNVRPDDPVQFGFDEEPRYAVLKQLPEAINVMQGRLRLSPSDAKTRLIDFFARAARRSAMPFLIEALKAEDPDSREIAHRTLTKLTGHDVDFEPESDDVEARTRAAGQWTAWWDNYRAKSDRAWPPAKAKVRSQDRYDS